MPRHHGHETSFDLFAIEWGFAWGKASNWFIPAHETVQNEHRDPDRVLNLLLSEREGGTWCENCVLQVSSKDYFGERDDRESGSENPPPAINELLPSVTDGEGPSSIKSVSERINLISFEGPEVRQERLRSLCTRYEAVFAESVRATAAHVPSMNLEIDADLVRQAGRQERRDPVLSHKTSSLS